MRIGVDVGGTKIEFVLLEESGEEISRFRVNTPKNDYKNTVRSIIENIEGLEKNLPTRCSVGIGIPGSLSPTTGLVRNANSNWLNKKPLLGDISAALKRTIKMENDANCFALSELKDGNAKNAQDIFAIILGTGVGAGLILGGRLVRGANKIAGEWGHNQMPGENGKNRKCWCGRYDCIETYLSGPALEREYLALSGMPLPALDIAIKADSGDIEAQEIIQLYEKRAARALASVINIIDPAAIILGGGLSNIHRFYKNIPKLWEPYIFSDNPITKLLPPYHGDSSGVRGAAWLWQ
ncbi:MAG: ROK family protein [Rhodospirillaceae bacterium]